MNNFDTKIVNIKWKGKAVENIKIAEGQEVSSLKRIIEETCGIPVKKQKLLFKGNVLKNDDIIEEKMFDSNQTILLLGSVAETDTLAHLSNATVLEAEPQNDSNQKSIFLGTGLKNLGNTCYVNSTLQVLFGLNQVCNLFGSFGDSDSLEHKDALLESLLNTLKSMKKGEESISPFDFILNLRHKLPIYAEKDKHGLYIQHDVHEFWSTFFSYLCTKSKKLQNNIIILEKKTGEDSCTYENVSNLFLPVTSETSNLNDSLSKALVEKVSDSSEISARLSFSNIPSFLPFVFMRFMWKTNEKVQAKILKLVSYPKTFDIYSNSSEPLKAEITAARTSIPDFGIYRLQFLITHTGREADSGHYMAWSKVLSSSNSNDWFKFDDDKVSLIKEEEVMKLGGGGDRPTAYMVFYVPSWNEAKVSDI